MEQPRNFGRSIPLSLFNEGKAEDIFEEVNQVGIKMVDKDGSVECILLSPKEYVRLLDEMADAFCMSEAIRQQGYASTKVYVTDEEIQCGMEINREEQEDSKKEEKP